MTRKLVLSVVATCVVCFGALVGVLAANWKPLLGLDLRGGLSVVYCPAAKHSTTTCATGKGVSKQKLDTAVSILSNRANAFGVAQPNIDLQGNNVVVQLPGVKNARKVERQIGSTAQLYFRPVLCYAPPYSKKAAKSASSASTTTSTTTAKSTGTSTSTPSTSTSTPSTSTSTPSTSTSTPSTSTPKSASGKNATRAPLPTCPASFTPSSLNPNPSVYAPLAAYQTTTVPSGYDPPNQNVLLPVQGGHGQRILAGPSQASGTVVASANAVYQPGSGYIVQFTLTKEGTKIWDDMATRNYHKLVADDLGGTIISAPVINATGSQFGNSGEVSGNFTSSTANALAVNLNYGAVPVTLVKVTSEVVSPSLGASSLRAGLLAGLLGLLLVMIYTIFYYRALGVVVVLGLVTTAALLYGVISMLGNSSFQLTLDLSGVTGLIVSVGITVDSYIVYFERLKDEVRAGRSIRASVDRGFKSAYRTILSADAVSLIGAVILWWLSVGNVRGFAFMLGLSTIIDVFTAYFFTRPLVILLGRNRLFTEARGLGVARGLAAAPSEAGA